MDKGSKQRSPPPHLKAETGSIPYAVQNTKLNAYMNTTSRDPLNAMHNPSHPFGFLSTETLISGSYKYVESLEDEIDELESDKAEFSNMYDMLLQECVSNDIMCSYLQSSSDLDEITKLQCLYLYKVRECDCLAQKLSEQTDFVSKEIYTELLRSFAKLEKHSISLKIALQQCQEQLKNDTVCKEKTSNVFRKEREQYFEIQDLKAQLTSNVNVVCATYGKCVFNSNHDACVSKFLNDVNARTKKPNVVPISARKPKSQAKKSIATPHKKTVAFESTTTNSKSYYRMLYKRTSKAWKWWIAQQCPSA
ncbi:hypothetical protein Tco_0204174 [Tanacetum coccineum]